MGKESQKLDLKDKNVCQRAYTTGCNFLAGQTKSQPKLSSILGTEGSVATPDR